MATHARSSIWLAVFGLAIAIEQGASAQEPAGASAPAANDARAAYTAPRNPWGDPDLQGDYSNKFEQGTPLERPQEFDGQAPRRHQGRRAGVDSAGTAGPRPAERDACGRRPRWKSRRTAALAGSVRHHQGQPPVVRYRSDRTARFPLLTPEARARAPPRQAARRGRGRRTPGSIAACTTAASRAGCPVR